MRLRRYFALAFVCASLFLILRATSAGPATKPTAQADSISERLTFLTLRLSSAEESIKAINSALRIAGYKVAVATEKVEAADKGNELMDRKGGAPVPWDQFYGKTARSFIAPLPPGSYSVKIKGSADAAYPWNDPIRRPRQFDYLYRANNEQAAKAKEEVAAMGRKFDQLLARRRQLEAEQASIWGTITLESIANREIATRSLYRFELKSAGDNASDAARIEIVRAAALFIRIADRAASISADAVATDQQAAFKALKENVQLAEGSLREAALRPIEAAKLNAAEAQQLNDLLATGKRMQLLCRNVTEGHTLSLESEAAADELRKQTMRAQLQESLIGFGDAISEFDERLTGLAGAWHIEGQAGIDTPDKLPKLKSVAATPAPAAITAVPPDAGAHPTQAPEVVKLFDGKTLAGWDGDAQYWSVTNGTIRGKSSAKGEGNLCAAGVYGNFILDADFKLVSGNSGIYFRSQLAPDFTFRAGYEADIYVPNAIGKLALGDQVIARPDAGLQKKVYKPGDWNHYTIEADGEHIRFWLNGTLVTDTMHRGPESGKIALQVHGPTEVHFRELRVRKLP